MVNNILEGNALVFRRLGATYRGGRRAGKANPALCSCPQTRGCLRAYAYGLGARSTGDPLLTGRVEADTAAHADGMSAMTGDLVAILLYLGAARTRKKGACWGSRTGRNDRTCVAQKSRSCRRPG